VYHVVFLNSSELFLGLMLLHYAGRAVERAFGSRKFAVRWRVRDTVLTQAFLVLTCVLHSVLSLAWGLAMLIISNALHMRAGPFANGYLPAGPVGFLTALVVGYYRTVPPFWTLRISELEVTDRMVVGIPFAAVREISPDLC